MDQILAPTIPQRIIFQAFVLINWTLRPFDRDNLINTMVEIISAIAKNTQRVCSSKKFVENITGNILLEVK